jgi:hypothetical protein
LLQTKPKAMSDIFGGFDGMDPKGDIFRLPRDIYYHEDDCLYTNPKVSLEGVDGEAEWVCFSLHAIVLEEALYFQYYGEDGNTLSLDEIQHMMEDPFTFYHA